VGYFRGGYNADPLKQMTGLYREGKIVDPLPTDLDPGAGARSLGRVSELLELGQ
jgi:hypothetical protein